ncbi:MAG: porin family protein [Dysgonamonadaceae bacterium]|jgi:opacity protein-like surface antigen|nr:porin family protein [Dysgonamonadaceae bacterium]
MKKLIFLVLFVSVSMISYSQYRGNLSVGLKGGYVYSSDYFRDFLYGASVDYHWTDALEVAFSGLMNPQVSFKDGNDKYEYKVYSANLDLRLYLLSMRTWGMGPALGGQYLYTLEKQSNGSFEKDVASLGFNIGWHTRFNITDNVRLNAGWRYTNIKDKSNDTTHDIGHHFFYAGLTYAFELF